MVSHILLNSKGEVVREDLENVEEKLFSRYQVISGSEVSFPGSPKKGGGVITLKIVLGAKCDIIERNKFGETPRHVAAKKGGVANVKELLGQGANANNPDTAGKERLGGMMTLI